MLVVAAAISHAGPALASAGRPLEMSEEQAFRQAARAVRHSLVRIQTVGGLDRIGGMLAGSAATTGVVISEDGYIVSSAFNFISKPSSILVRLADGRPQAARLVATDRLRMLTLLKVDANGLVPVRAARNPSVRVGQWAIALGRTYEGADPSVSVGIVSAVNRVWGKAIQTDAKVSPVNYGGPLIDIRGDVLGVIVPLSPSGKEESAGIEWYDSGIGFAIPFNDVLSSVERLKAGKDLHPGLLGVTIQDGGLDENPAIDVVRYDSPAERAGLKSGDAIIEIDGRPVRRQDEVKLALGRKYAGDKIAIIVQRGESRIRADAQLVDVLLPYEPGFLGILPERQGADATRGVTVRFVFAGSPAAAAGIVVGDRIRACNGTAVSSPDQLASVVRRVRPETFLSLQVAHDDSEKTLSVKLTTVSEEIPQSLPLPPPAPASARPAVGTPAAGGTQAPNAKNAGGKPKTGYFNEKLPGDAGPHFWAYVPEMYSPADSWGLMVWIPPAPDSIEPTILARWKVQCAERRLLLVAPLPAEAGGFTPSDLLGAKQVVENFLKVYRIEPNRVVVHSFASGGPFAAEFAFDNRELVRGLVLVSTVLVGPPPESHPSFPLRFYFAYGEKERVGDRVRRVVEVLRAMKYAVTLRVDAQNERAYLSDDETAEAARWIDSLDRI